MIERINMSTWFSFNDDETITNLGKHEHFDGADEVAPGNSVWLFTDNSLRALNEQIKQALEES